MQFTDESLLDPASYNDLLNLVTEEVVQEALSLLSNSVPPHVACIGL